MTLLNSSRILTEFNETVTRSGPDELVLENDVMNPRVTRNLLEDLVLEALRKIVEQVRHRDCFTICVPDT
jgi:hypothetical protein